MRFLFALRTIRQLQSTLRDLAGRGHEIVVALERQTSLSSPAVAELREAVPGLTVRAGVGPQRTAERDLPRALRSWLDYFWFFEPAFADSPKLRARAATFVPSAIREGTATAAHDPELRRALTATIGALERTFPVPAPYLKLVKSERPDVVVVSPLLPRASPQINYLRAAHELGMATAYCVASWDNLTTKGTIHEPVDLVAVWNEPQKREAVKLHGVASSRVAVTGAPLYDEWFGREPSTTRAEFAERVGMPPDRPYILYACSSHFIAPNEATWILRWLRELRSSGEPELKHVSVLVRPHPANPLTKEPEKAQRLAATRGLVVHPDRGVEVSAEEDLAVYYDSLYHAAAVVGINTSALVEAALVGRGVYVLLTERYRDTQEGVPHFGHLRTAGGGLIHATERPEEHAQALGRALRGEDVEESAERARSFVADFIRPQGLDRPSTPLLADALETLAAKPRTRRDQPAPPSQEWLDHVAGELEPIFHIRRGSSVKKPPPKTSARKAPAARKGSPRARKR